MENEINTWLTDIKQAITEIYTFLPQPRNFFEFQKNIMARKAVERNIEIIGEAINRILKKSPNINITNARKIVDTRNRFSHGYDSISLDVVWAIVNLDLPILEKDIDALIEK